MIVFVIVCPCGFACIKICSPSTFSQTQLQSAALACSAPMATLKSCNSSGCCAHAKGSVLRGMAIAQGLTTIQAGLRSCSTNTLQTSGSEAGPQCSKQLKPSREQNATRTNSIKGGTESTRGAPGGSSPCHGRCQAHSVANISEVKVP